MSSALLPSVSASLPGFHPMQLDNGTTQVLRAWFDPRDPRTRTITAGRVSSYLNKVSGVAATEPAADGPALGTTLNGGPCLVGNGAAVLASTEAAILSCWTASGGLAPQTVIALLQGTALPAGPVCSVGRSDEPFIQSSTFEWQTLADSPNCWTYARSPAVGVTVQWFGGNPSTASPIAIAMRFNGTAPTLRFNGATIAMPTTAASGAPPGVVTSPQRFSMLARARQNFPGKASMLLGPLLLYTGSMSDADCDVALAGLQHWYGLP